MHDIKFVDILEWILKGTLHIFATYCILFTHYDLKKVEDLCKMQIKQECNDLQKLFYLLNTVQRQAFSFFLNIHSF